MKKTNNLSLRKQFALQEILSDVSSNFVAFDEKNAKQSIIDALERLGQFVNADRVYVFDYDFKANVCNNTYEWCQKDIEPMIDLLQAVPLNDIQDWVSKHLKGESLYYPDVMALDPSDGVRQILEPQGVLSLIAVPMMMGKKCYGFIGLDSVKEKYIYSEFEQKILWDFSKILMNFMLRIEAEDKLIESQLQLRSVLDAQEVLIFRYTPDFKVSYINQKALQYFKRVESMVLNRPIFEFIKFEEHLRLPSTSIQTEFNTWINGLAYWMQWEIIPIFSSSKQLVEVQCIGRDISQTKRMSMELESFQKRYEYVLEASGIGAWEWNILTESITIDNQHAFQLGFTKEELYPLSFDKYVQMIHPDDQTRFQDYCANLIEGVIERIVIEYRIKHKLGHYIWIKDQGKVMAWAQGKFAQLVYGTSQDVTEEHIRQEQLRVISQAIDQNANALIITKANSEIIYVNQAFTAMMGYSGDEVIGKSSSILNSGYHDRAFYDQLWATISQGQTWKGRFRNQRKNGEYYWEEAAINPVIDEHGQISYFIANKSDISVRLELERKIEVFNEKVSKLFKNVPGLVFQFQMRPDGSTFFPLVSEGISDYEVTANDVFETSDRLYQYIFSEDLRIFKESLIISADQLTPFELKFRIMLPKKGLRWVSGYANPERLEDGSTLWHGYLQDITDQILRDKALKVIEESLNLAIEATNAGVWDYDMVTGSVQYNEQWKIMLGYAGDEVEANFDGWRKLWHPDDVNKIENAIDAYLNKDNNNYEVIHRLRHKNGEYRWIMTRGRIIYDDQDKPFRWIGTNIDITERMEIETILEENNRQLLHARIEAESANKLKTFFLANISHEIRTPMNAILAYSYLLSKDELSSSQKAKLNNIIRSGEHLMKLITDILDMSIIESGKQKLNVETFDLHSMIEDVQSILAHQAQNKHLDFIFTHNVPQGMFVQGDVSKLRQILINLGNNAIKFTEQGKVGINFEQKHLDAKISLIKICVTDSGPGISSHDLQEIFKPFVHKTYREKVEGTGLGLAITKNYLDMMEGQIQVENNPEGGANFCVELKLKHMDPQNEVEMNSQQFILNLSEEQHNDQLRTLHQSVEDWSGFEEVILSGDIVGMQTFLNPFKEKHPEAVQQCEVWIHDFEYEKLLRWIYDGE